MNVTPSFDPSYQQSEQSVASAATCDLHSVLSDNVLITGTTTITSFGSSAPAGIRVFGRFADVLTLTHNATSLILPGGANITTAANDRFIAVSLGSGNWIVSNYVKASGEAVVAAGATLVESATVTASGASVDFTGIPSTARRIIVIGNGLSSSSDGILQSLIGDSGGFEITGYVTNYVYIKNTAINIHDSGATTYHQIINNFTAARTADFILYLDLLETSSNTWSVQSFANRVDGGNYEKYISHTFKSLSGTLDRIRIATSAGTFDAGKIKLSYFTS